MYADLRQKIILVELVKTNKVGVKMIVAGKYLTGRHRRGDFIARIDLTVVGKIRGRSFGFIQTYRDARRRYAGLTI